MPISRSIRAACEVMAIWRYLEAHHLKELERVGLVEVVRNGKLMNVLLRRDVLRAYSEYLKQL
jgi:hypothetical protein